MINNSNCYENDPLHPEFYKNEPTAGGRSCSGQADPFPAVPHGRYLLAAALGAKWPLSAMAAAGEKVLEAQGLHRTQGARPRSPVAQPGRDRCGDSHA